MAFSRRFTTRLVARTATLFAATMATAALAIWARAPTATLVAGFATIFALASLWRLVDEGNADLSRFLAALDRGDLTQSFQRAARGSSFGRVGAAYDRALSRLRLERAAGAATARFAEALADGAPIALLVLQTGDRVTIANKAARRLLGLSGDVPLSSLDRFGPTFTHDLASLRPGISHLSMLSGQRVLLDATLMESGDGPRRIVSVKVVQPELDRAELKAQIDLVRVLTHEIMNSLTPVVSLAATADRLIASVPDDRSPGIADARLAVSALARRATELERFVESYKGFSEAPVLVRAPVEVEPWLSQLRRLFEATPLGRAAQLRVSMAPHLPAIDGDAALLTQALLNLLKNAAEAIEGHDGASILLAATANPDGSIAIAVADSGDGVPAHLREEVFLPFFTTKRGGTGIGLSLVRQVVLLHGGRIGIADGEPSRFELTLPAAA